MEKSRSYSTLLFLIFFSINGYSQDISGSWRWFEKEDQSFEIYLKKSTSEFSEFDFIGTHCGVAFNGDRMDCTYESYSIFLKKIDQNVFVGKITSAYSLTDFEIRLIYLEESKKILWEVTKEGPGLFYFPLKVVLN
ncbi:hypothetical protein [Algoriphagus formosus]|uniref:hypothetical protein n=1 Tax=Algoriphagus formosus TaxID=2007308 RepID=UPI003F714431